MARLIVRRRLIGIAGAAAGLALLPSGVRPASGAHRIDWRGNVLGAPATMQIHHPDPIAVAGMITRIEAELRRLDAVFSLYRQDSAIAVLNRQGGLAAPPAELVALLERAAHYWSLTGGAFDPTVQPLWVAHYAHFARPGADPNGLPEAELAAARAKVGFDGLRFDRNRIAFARPGMGLTLNGIAQGYVTDRAVEMLRAEGVGQTLVDMGESRAIGARPDGSAWQVGIADPANPERPAGSLALADAALATSAAYGFRFDAAGRCHHLFDPRTGRSPRRFASVTTVMPTATAADALSTAFNLLPPDSIRAILREMGGGRVRAISLEGNNLDIET